MTTSATGWSRLTRARTITELPRPSRSKAAYEVDRHEHRTLSRSPRARSPRAGVRAQIHLLRRPQDHRHSVPVYDADLPGHRRHAGDVRAHAAGLAARRAAGLQPDVPADQ